MDSVELDMELNSDDDVIIDENRRAHLQLDDTCDTMTSQHDTTPIVTVSEADLLERDRRRQQTKHLLYIVAMIVLLVLVLAVSVYVIVHFATK